LYGNISELGDVGSEPGKSYLFFLTTFDPGIRLTGDRVNRLGNALNVFNVRCLSDGP
jgi:hypothetical protein